jgi:hypothetical protein
MVREDAVRALSAELHRITKTDFIRFYSWPSASQPRIEGNRHGLSLL